MRKFYYLIAAFFCLLLGNMQAQEGSVEQWQNNPAIRKNARVDALLKSHNHLSKIRSKKSLVPVPDKPAYGFLMDNNEVPDKLGLISFRLPKPDIYTTIMPADMDNVVWTGVYVEDTYYAFMVRISASGFAFPTYLATIDLTTGERHNILDISLLLGQGLDAITFADMTYDYSTSTVYATANTGLFQSSLYKFSLVDGTITPVVKLGIEHYLVSLACSYDGQLYGMSTGGGLYKINKEDGSAEIVGNTGYKPWYIQSMEFDHTDNQLYWAGADAEHTFIARIDTKTSEAYEMGTFVPNSQIMGLHIPFTKVLKGAPDKVTDFVITPGQKGNLSSTLSWTNPIADPFSNKLTGKLGIKIYRNNELLTDITNKEPGEKCSFIDRNFSTNGNYNYRLVPYNSVGIGEFLKKNVWIGEDTPNAPENITTTVDGTSVIIGWAAPSIGVHGGWMNEAKLKYSITRLPDNAVIATSLTKCSYTDKNLESLGKWSYKVTVTDDVGNTADAESEPVVAGPGLISPVTERFDNKNSTNLWSFFNLNGDDCFWNWRLDPRNQSNGMVSYDFSYSKSAEEWMITPPMKLEAQHRYRISFDKKNLLNSSGRWKEELTLTVGKSPHPQQQATTLAEIVFDNYDWDNSTAEFVPEDNSNYYFGFYLHSNVHCGEPCIDNIIIKEVFFYDLQAVLIEGPQSAVVKLPSDFTVTVRNEGSRPVTSYKIGLTDENGNALTELVTFSEAINPGETKKLKLQWRPEEVKVQNIKAVVTVIADGDETNNVSNTISVDTQDPNAPRTVTLGTKEVTYKWPFQFDKYGTTRSQSLYLASEINSPGGIITSLKWYSNFSELAVNEPVQIYMANTSETSLKDNWIDDSQLVLVYEGNVSIAKKQEILDVVLNGAFLYTGQNLCVDVRKITTKSYSWRDGFYNYTLAGSSATRFENFGAVVIDNKPMLTIQLNSAGAKMSGKITCAGQPVDDVLVKIEENGLSAKSGADGTYLFDLINYGTYHISYYVHGYFKVVKEITITDTTPIVEDVSLIKIPQVKVKGRIDNRLDVPAQGLEVKLKGYGDYKITTDANGAFEFADVYAIDTYELSVSTKNYSPFTKQIDLNVQSDIDLGSLALDEIAYPVYGLSLNESTLNWYAPVEQKECRYDDGTMAQTAGFLPQFTSNKSLFGAVYQTPGKVTKVKWYIASLKGETTKKVNLFIMNIDAEGNPTAEPIYIAENIISSCGTWFEYSLSNPAVAPNGFLVGIGSSTESVNLGVDTGVDENYPDVSNTKMFFTDDYSVQYAKASLYGANFMVRADYLEMEPQELPTAGLVEGYNVYRMREGDESNKESWKLLNKVTGLSYTDVTLADAEKGYYRYGVSVKWEGVPESEALISDVIAKDMLTKVSLRIVPNIGDTKAVLGAEVSLICDDGIHKYTAKVTEDNGKLVFDQVHRGIYSVSVSHPRFDLYKKTDINLSNEPYYSLGTYTVKERLTMPVNLQIKNVEEGSNRYHLEWNLTSAIFEDFESHPDFELNSPGAIGWQYIDNDKGRNTYGIQDADYPNKGAGTAYIIFNPSATKPRLDGNPDICAWSGDRYLASFSSQKPNDDYFISPELFFSEDFHFSFYARSLTADYGMERINVGYSTSDAELQSFTWLVPADYLNINVVWQQYDYVIPADAKHVAIRCLSDNAFLLMIDDVQIGGRTPQVYKSYAKSYKVYLNGTYLTSLTGNTYEFAINGAGSHTVGVEAIYETGVSEMSTLVVDNGSSVSVAKANDSFLYYSDGKLVFDGKADYIKVYSSTGVLVAQYTNVMESVPVSSLPKGVYMVHAEVSGQRIMNKIIIK